MRYQSTVFGQLLKVLPRASFERLAQRHRQGRLKRALSPWGHLVTMVLAQVSGARSLRDLERMLGRQPGVLAHLGLPGLRGSTLSDANARRPAVLFAAVAHLLAFERLRGAGRRVADCQPPARPMHMPIQPCLRDIDADKHPILCQPHAPWLVLRAQAPVQLFEVRRKGGRGHA